MTAIVAAEASAVATVRSDQPAAGTEADAAAAGGGQPATASAPTTTSTSTKVAAELHAAVVERGRIASMAGVTGLIWLAIIVLMVWGSS